MIDNCCYYLSITLLTKFISKINLIQTIVCTSLCISMRSTNTLGILASTCTGLSYCLILKLGNHFHNSIYYLDIALVHSISTSQKKKKDVCLILNGSTTDLLCCTFTRIFLSISKSLYYSYSIFHVDVCKSSDIRWKSVVVDAMDKRSLSSLLYLFKDCTVLFSRLYHELISSQILFVL